MSPIRSVFVLAALAPLAYGQGCIIARSNGEAGGPSSEGGYLSPGEFSFGVDYRHQFSFRHFIGPTEQTQRIALGTQVENKINLENFSVTYQATPRFSFTVDIPLLTASRRANNATYTQVSRGIGDSAFMANGWLWNPTENTRGNVQLGVGIVLPTGSDNRSTVEGPAVVTNDYSIQPGTGGYGIALQWVAYKNVKAFQLYFNGNYLVTPQNYNSVQRSATSLANPLTAYNSITDQYLLQAGVAMPVKKVRGLTVTLGPRQEGVPAHDLIGDSLGFRRPGFAISVEPGVQYYRGSSVFTASFGRALYRDRTRSVPDILTGGHGDAAFADWVWFASYRFRWNPHASSHQHHQMADHS